MNEKKAKAERAKQTNVPVNPQQVIPIDQVLQPQEKMMFKKMT